MAPARILAIASGKGGVGKTLTSVNLALMAARDGMRTALVDADPLSNVMALLDHSVPPRPLPDVLEDPGSQAFIAAPGMEVIFPQSKPSPIQAAGLVRSLVESHRDWLDERYALVIIDMPAGARAGEDFPYLTAVDALMLVTNPEPTAHVAAGALLRSIREIWSDRPVLLWHNKYEGRPEEEFDPDDVVANYNRNVPDDERIDGTGLIPVAFVPPDPALDLVRSDPPISVDLHRSLIDAIDALADGALPPIPAGDGPSPRSAALVAYFLRKADIDSGGDAVIEKLSAFIASETRSDGRESLPDRLENELRSWINEAARSPLRRQILQVREVAALRLAALEAEDALFAAAGPSPSSKGLDREMIPLLKSLSCLPPESPLTRMAALLLFRYALLKLFSNQSAVRLISAFLPKRTEGGAVLRDRRRQIVRLMGRDAAYQARYFALVKKVYPAISRQLDHLVTTFGLHALLFRGKDGNVARNAYARLFSATLYEIVNSGLGIVAGFRFRPSSRAFKSGYDALMEELGV